MVSPTQFFLLGADISSPYTLHIYKITFGSTAVDWANKQGCSSGTWVVFYSESLLSSDNSTLYSFYSYGPVKYLYFAAFSVSSGSVSNIRYKSSVSTLYARGSALNGDYIVVSVYYPVSLLIYSISINTFVIKISSSIKGWGVDPSSGR